MINKKWTKLVARSERMRMWMKRPEKKVIELSARRYNKVVRNENERPDRTKNFFSLLCSAGSARSG